MKEKTVFDYKQALAYAQRYCSMQEHTCKEVADKLRLYGADVQDIDAIIDELKINSYIDEYRYACLYVRSKVNQNKWGCKKIEMMLRLKGISLQDIARAVATMDADVYRQTLYELLQKKLPSLQKYDKYAQKSRLRYFSASHGFENEITEEVLKELGF